MNDTRHLYIQGFPRMYLLKIGRQVEARNLLKIARRWHDPYNGETRCHTPGPSPYARRPFKFKQLLGPTCSQDNIPSYLCGLFKRSCQVFVVYTRPFLSPSGEKPASDDGYVR